MMKRKSLMIFIFFSSLLFGFYLGAGDIYFEISKNIEIFGRVYKEVTTNYVDEISPSKFMKSGIDGMLQTLDPYSNFIEESKKADIDLLTTGKYGGIGISIGIRSGEVTITEIMAGYSAQRQGLRVGDIILFIDSVKVNAENFDEVGSLVRGQPGTEVDLTIKRAGESQNLVFHLVREEIQVRNLTFGDFIPNSDGVIYLKLDRFSRRAGEELKQAYISLKEKGQIKACILDLRDNPGGLLESAVEVLDKFIPAGEKLVETRGRSPESSKEYYAHETPIFENIPLAVLINGNSASASEIVAGCIQDLDRGIITGSQSFGKGLVQTVIPIAYNTMLKMTTAKYYTPSGRCIQKLDYMHTSKGTFVSKPDSLKKLFYTKNKRKVFEAGGVTPDSIISSNEYSDIAQELLKQGMFFKFTTFYLSRNKDLDLNNLSQQKLIELFIAFLKEQKFKTDDKIQSKFDELNNLLSNTKSYSKLVNELNVIKDKAKLNLETEVNANKDEIYYLLMSELNSRVEGENGRIKTLLNFDKQISETVKILSNPKLYSKLLSAN